MRIFFLGLFTDLHVSNLVKLRLLLSVPRMGSSKGFERWLDYNVPYADSLLIIEIEVSWEAFSIAEQQMKVHSLGRKFLGGAFLIEDLDSQGHGRLLDSVNLED